MEEEILLADHFFSVELPNALDQLAPDAKPLWGVMTPQHMVEHLIVT